MTPSIERALAALNAAKKTLKSAVATQQKKCKHVKIAECDYVPSNGYGAFVPIRICLSCGMTEEGWGCGYIVLKGTAVPIDRNELYTKRQGLMILDKHKGPLLRKELTVVDYVNGVEPEEEP